VVDSLKRLKLDRKVDSEGQIWKKKVLKSVCQLSCFNWVALFVEGVFSISQIKTH